MHLSQVLIETLWNVNSFGSLVTGRPAKSFNRNIVECKSGPAKEVLHKYGVLIETLWNVNTTETGFSFTRRIVLIETLWNVNKRSIQNPC